MACKSVCKLCNRLVISQSVTYASGVLTVNIPAGSYQDGCTYCIVIAQSIPDDAIINAPVVVTIGTGTVNYPLTRCDCSQVTAAALRTRTKYKTRVSTNSTGGVFKVLGKLCDVPNNALTAINGGV